MEDTTTTTVQLPPIEEEEEAVDTGDILMRGDKEVTTTEAEVGEEMGEVEESIGFMNTKSRTYGR